MLPTLKCPIHPLYFDILIILHTLKSTKCQTIYCTNVDRGNIMKHNWHHVEIKLEVSFSFSLWQNLPNYNSLSIYISIHLPDYGNSISREDIDRIQIAQNATIRFVFCFRRFDHYRENQNMITMTQLHDWWLTKPWCLGGIVYLKERLISGWGHPAQHSLLLSAPLSRSEIWIQKEGRSYLYVANTDILTPQNCTMASPIQ